MKAIVLSSLFSFALALPPRIFGRQSSTRNSTTSNQTAADPGACSHPTGTFRQPLYHQNTINNQTFEQRYQVIDDFFRPGGPILFYQGAETPEFTCLEAVSLYEFAKELGALAVSLEHRFFGESAPFSLNFTDNAEWPTSDLTSLTLDNVLLDSVRFVEWIKSTIPGAEHSDVIVFGGSYGGFLSTMLRTHHPEVFYGSVASSSIGNGFVTSPHDPNLYLQTEYLEQVYLEQSAKVSNLIRSGMSILKQRFEAGNFTNLASELNLCSPPNATDQYPALALYLIDSFYSIAQYNYNLPLGGAPASPLQCYINVTSSANSTSPLVALANAANIANQMTNQQCGEWNTSPRGGGQTIPFAWIMCTYFPYTDVVFTTPTSIFGPLLPDYSMNNINEEICQSYFGIPARSGDGIREEYGITQSEMESLTRIVFSEGLVDPVTALGPSPFFVGNGSLDGAEKAKMILISGAGHGEDLFASTPHDSLALKAARRAEVEAIKEWVK